VRSGSAQRVKTTITGTNASNCLRGPPSDRFEGGEDGNQL